MIKNTLKYILLSLCAVLLAGFVCGCNKDKQAETAAGAANKLKTQELDTSSLEVKKIDINKDGRYDQYIYYDGDKIRYTQRDFNFDGIVDMTEFYEDGAHVRDEIDLDYDGICDVIITYKNELPVKKEYAVDFEGNRHGTQFFNEKGERIRIERDTDNDGKPDRIEHYNPGEEEPYKVDGKR